MDYLVSGVNWYCIVEVNEEIFSLDPFSEAATLAVGNFLKRKVCAKSKINSDNLSVSKELYVQKIDSKEFKLVSTVLACQNGGNYGAARKLKKIFG